MLDRSQIEMETGKHRDKRTERKDIAGRRRKLKHEQVRRKEQDKRQNISVGLSAENRVVNVSAPLFLT